MPANYYGATTVIVIDPSGTPVTANGKLLHFTESVGANPAQFVVLWMDKTPATFTPTTYLGKTCTLTINGTLACTGILGKTGMYDLNQETDSLGVTFTVIDSKHEINAYYIGQNFLETLDSNGLPVVFVNGLPYYGADFVFNHNGLPNRNPDIDINQFLPPAYEHNTAPSFRAYWTFGQALEWIWYYCVEPLTGIPMPTVGGDTPKDWTFGGMDKKLDRFGPLLGMPMAACIDELLKKTRVQWTIDLTGTPKFFCIGQYVDTLTLTSSNDPNDDTQTSAFDMHVEHNVMDSVGQVDLIGGKEQREILLKTEYSGSVYTADLVLTSTDFEQAQWFGIDAEPGWLTYANYIIPAGTIAWSNYNVQRYIHYYLNQAGWITSFPNEYTYRYNIKPDVWESHKVGGNIGTDDQPYRMLPELLVARSKTGAFINPDQENAFGGVSPLELLRTQYDTASIDLDRGFLFASGVEPFVVDPLEFIAKPYFATSNPLALTIAMECAYRAWVSVSTPVSGLSYQNHRAVIRDDLIHKTREATKIVFPEVATIDALGNKTLADGVALPSGWTKNFVNSFSGPLLPWALTATATAGVVVDGKAELQEVADTISAMVGIVLIDGSFYIPGWKPVKIGTNLLDGTSTWKLGTDCIVTAVCFSDESQATEIQFTNRLSRDVIELAQNFVDQRKFRF